VEFDAVILAGGRSARLGGVPKPELRYGGDTLLARSLQAARGALAVVVVGPDPGTLPEGVLTCRESPAFAGPAAAIAAGLDALRAQRAGRAAPMTLVLACDMPHVAAAVSALLEAAEGARCGVPAGAEGHHGAGIMAVAAGRRQPLVGLYDTAALQRSADGAARRGALENASVFALVASLEVQEVIVPAGSTDDVDTWDDASALGVSGLNQARQPGGPSGAPQLRPTLEATVKSQDETLEDWCRALLQALELEDVEIDVNEVLALAGVAAHSVVRPAAPLTTFIAGFAAGLATGSGQATDTVSMQAAMAVARKLAKDHEAAEASGA
jgi:molybdopterin-guanine dinucleotide biosynthesis protein A